MMRSRRQSLEDERLALHVLDVTSTAVALSVYSPTGIASPLTHTPDSSSQDRAATAQQAQDATAGTAKPSAISIQLDGRPWPHVAHAGSVSVESLAAVTSAAGEQPASSPTVQGTKANETTVIIYGLDPGRDYEITLEVVASDEGGEPEQHQATIDVETATTESRRPSFDAANASQEPLEYAGGSASSSAPDGPPPPYSAAVPSAAASEPQLRALLKRIRASSKRTESVLNASISALKKSVEKGLKEDQRARTRIVGLEEAIRKTSDGTRDMRTTEMDACDERIRKLEELEEETREELDRRREGKSSTPQSRSRRDSSPPPPPPAVPTPAPSRHTEDAGEEEDTHEGVADLARELDSLNRMIEEAEKETTRRATDSLRALENELERIDDEIVYLDREEAHRYALASAHRSSDSLTDRSGIAPVAQQSSASGFNLRWKRNTPAIVPNVAPVSQQSQDPRSFGRFFRRAPNPAESSSHQQADGADSPTSLVPGQITGQLAQKQEFAQAHQAKWMPSVDGSTTSPTTGSGSGSGSGSSSVKTSQKMGLLRRRSESVNSASSERSGESKDSGPNKNDKVSGSWGRLGAWSQVGKTQKSVVEEES